MRLGVTLPALTLVVAARAAANPAPIGASGRMPIPVPPQKVSGIALAAETVVITDGVRQTVDGFAPGSKMTLLQTRYEGRYLLVNLGQTPRSLSAGESANGVEALKMSVQGRALEPKRVAKLAASLVAVSTLTEALQLRPEEIAELTAKGWAKFLAEDPDYLDLAGLGRDAKTAAKKLATSRRITPPSATALVELVAGESDFSFSGELVWFQTELRFAPGETVELEVSYLSTRAWEGLPYEIGYVLTSARFWDGPIGLCRIVIEKSPRLPATAYRIERPKGFVAETDRWVFEQRDFVPSADLLVRVEPP
jgi:hypothetical protein